MTNKKAASENLDVSQVVAPTASKNPRIVRVEIPLKRYNTHRQVGTTHRKYCGGVLLVPGYWKTKKLAVSYVTE